jgi:hypothetical protein
MDQATTHRRTDAMLAPNTALTPRPHVAAAPTATPAPLDLAALVGAAGWARLPEAVQRRFAAAHADTVYRGHMDLACSRIGRVVAVLSAVFGGPLTGRNAQQVPTTVQVRGNGRGGVVWERRFQRDADDGHDAPERVVRSTKEIDTDGITLRERTDGGLSMALRVFEEDGELVFESQRYFFALGRWRLPVPALLSPGVCRVSHRDLGAGRFRFTLAMTHPLWGQTFHQTGVFADPE